MSDGEPQRDDEACGASVYDCHGVATVLRMSHRQLRCYLLCKEIDLAPICKLQGEEVFLVEEVERWRNEHR